ncbi:MAG: RNA methyltransferase [Candidatus Rhabdochlamydia sp.]
MIPQQICSLQHPLVKRLVKLRENSSFRLQENALVITGQSVIEELSLTHSIEHLISLTPLNIPAKKLTLASKEVLEKIAGHPTQDLVAAEILLPHHAPLQGKPLIVLLDEVADPGNVGTIFRTALALGWDGVFVIEKSADPYNDKVLRSSRGATLRLPWQKGSWDEALLLIQKGNYHVVVADIQGAKVQEFDYKRPLILVLGHETKGPSLTAKENGIRITIPMKKEMESLNVASAASILLYHIQETFS